MSSITVRWSGRAAAAVVATSLGLSALAVSPALAGPTDATANGDGEVFLTSATSVAKGQQVSFVGTGFAAGASAFQRVFAKFDDKYSGTATTGTTNSTVGNFQVQGDGSVSGSIVIPDDIDDSSVNPLAAEGPHWIRILGSLPATSHWSDDFAVAADADVAPAITTTTALTSGRSGSNVVVTVNATGFKPNEVVTVSKANDATNTTIGTLTADADGAITAKTVSVALGTTLPAGEWQLIFNRADHDDAPGIAQITVGASVSVTSAALDSDGTVTISNAQPSAKFTEVSFDPDSDATTDNDIVVATDTLVASDAGVATGTIHVPDGATNLGTKSFTVDQSFPYATSYTATAKISPSTATFGEANFTSIKSADGAVKDGLYQSAYSAKNNVVFATTAYQTTATDSDATSGWDGTLYKLDADTLAVLSSVRAPFVSGGSGARYAPYGVGVDDTNGTVWVTNTRQNTVSVYSQSDLSVLASGVGTVSHSRDVLADPEDGYVFVSSASEGTTGDGYISVYEADDKNGNGTKYEWLQNVATGPRSDYSPMSLTYDAASHTLYSPSLSSAEVLKLDTQTLETSFITVAGINVGGRGASGIAYDSVTNRLFVASQNSDELVIADGTSGATIAEVPTGAGALNVAFDPVNRLAYVANFSGTTITVVDPDGAKVANLPFGRTNHVAIDGKGSVFAVDKNTGNHVTKLTYKVADDPTGTPTTAPTTTPTTTPSTTPAVVLTPAQQKVAKAQATVAKDKAKISALKAKIKSTTKAKAKKLKKKLVKAKKQLAKDKKKLAKAKKALKTSKK